jgi:epoxyqueuosine reductase QueG
LSNADFLESEAPRLENWLSQHMQGNMSYMENHFDKRLDPRKLVDGCKTNFVNRLIFPDLPDFHEQPYIFRRREYLTRKASS